VVVLWHMFLIICGCLLVRAGDFLAHVIDNLWRAAVSVCNKGGAGVCLDFGHLFLFFEGYCILFWFC